MTVGELIQMLSALAEKVGDDAPVLLVQQPRLPMVYAVSEVAEDDGTIYIGEGEQQGYLPDGVEEKLWQW